MLPIVASILRELVRAGLLLAPAALLGACQAGPPQATPPINPGTSAAPREVNIIAKDWHFLPDHVELVHGETVLFHFVNGGLDVHEFVIGDAAVQDAWERAEAATAGHPPGPTPFVSVAPELSGIRVVVESGQRVDLVWTVPLRAAEQSVSDLVVGCHIPGHWARGMVVPVTFVPSPGAP